jgi:hypothetical protein
MNSEINKDTTIFLQQKEMELLVRKNNKLLTRYRTVQRANLRLKKQLMNKENSDEDEDEDEEISDEWVDIN